MGPIAAMYLELHAEVEAFARSLTSDDFGVAVPATPSWSVHDLLAHVTGIPDDALHGRMLDSIGESRPVFDLLTHEHDLRGAVRRPGRRTGGPISALARQVLEHLDTGGRLTVETESGRVVEASASPSVVLHTTDFEVFRSRFGRRSLAQVRAYDWRGDPQPVIAGWFIFGPAADGVVE